MIVAGIDPGKAGGLTALNSLGQTLVILPIEEGLDWLLATPKITHVFVERASSRPGQGVSSVFTFGTGYGVILGILRAMQIPHTLVPPAAWSRVMHAGTKVVTTKERSLEAARRLFPGETWRTGKQRTPQDGLYESALIAAYGLRVLAGQTLKAGGAA